jgi:SAM-dependent methyltransferase
MVIAIVEERVGQFGQRPLYIPGREVHNTTRQTDWSSFKEEKMAASVLEFDAPFYQHINHVREVWLRRIVGQLPFRAELRTALDIGCGAGHFSGVLDELGFMVTGVDLRDENLDICRQRYPRLTFATANLDGDFSVPRHDLVLLFGILYHLQSPLTALPRLAAAIGRIGIVSTRVAAGRQMMLHLFRENRGPAHNRAAVTAVPTLPALVAIFHLSGLEYVYLPDEQPDHPEWQVSSNTHGRRYSLVVAREPLPIAGWRRLPAYEVPPKWGPANWLTQLRKKLVRHG